MFNAIYSMSISDRHLELMLKAGVLRLFPLVATYASDYSLTDKSRYPMFQVTEFAWKCVAAIGLNISLMPSGRSTLKADTAAMDVLRKMAGIKPGGSALLEQARKDAKLALFELSVQQVDDGIAGTSASGGGGARGLMLGATVGADITGVGTSASSSPPADDKHVMVSYCWAEQDVVLRLVEKLKAQGLKIWIDVEMMRGSTIDAMAEAVEMSSVVCICMSNSYKESANCRFEANYVTLQQIPYVCCIMEQGYKPKGWLGMMLGLNLWYAFFGETLATDSAFDSKVADVMKAILHHHHRYHRPVAAAAAATAAVAAAALAATASATAMAPTTDADDSNAPVASASCAGSSHAPAVAKIALGGGAVAVGSPALPRSPSPALHHEHRPQQNHHDPLSNRGHDVQAPSDPIAWPADANVHDLDGHFQDLDSVLKGELAKLTELRDCGLIDEAAYRAAAAAQLKSNMARRDACLDRYSSAFQFHKMYADGVITASHLSTHLGRL